MPRPARSTLFPYTTLFRSVVGGGAALVAFGGEDGQPAGAEPVADPAERVDAGHGVSCWSGAARHGGHPCRPRDRGVLPVVGVGGPGPDAVGAHVVAVTVVAHV